MSASLVIDRLYVGSAPNEGTALSHKIDALVLCAEEYQPPRTSFDVPVTYAPLDDSGRVMSERETRIALHTGKLVCLLMRAKKRVLVTCWQGRNRSGLVAALALLHCFSWLDAEGAIALVRSVRGASALRNPQFTGLIYAVARLRAAHEARVSV